MLWPMLPLAPALPPPPCPCCAYNGMPSRATEHTMLKTTLILIQLPPLLALVRTKHLAHVQPQVERKTVLRESDAAVEAQLCSPQLAWLECHPGAHSVFSGQVIATRGKCVLKNSALLSGCCPGLSLL